MNKTFHPKKWRAVTEPKQHRMSQSMFSARVWNLFPNCGLMTVRQDTTPAASPALCDSTDYGPPGSSCPWDFSQARILGWLPFPCPGHVLDSGTEPASLAWKAGSLPLSHLGSSATCIQCHRQGDPDSDPGYVTS